MGGQSTGWFALDLFVLLVLAAVYVAGLTLVTVGHVMALAWRTVRDGPVTDFIEALSEQ